jgi:hypothetical protein
MESVTGERCIELMKEQFPRFSSYSEVYIREHGADSRKRECLLNLRI